MWNYVRLHREGSPMAEILSQCSCKSNLRLVIYHLSENHVECATMPNADTIFKLTSETARCITNDARGGAHAILAFDVEANTVFLIDSTPKLEIASAVLLCVVTELLNGCVQPRECVGGRPTVAENSASRFINECKQMARDSRGRFVKSSNPCGCNDRVGGDEGRVPSFMGENTVLNRRFRIGKH